MTNHAAGANEYALTHSHYFKGYTAMEGGHNHTIQYTTSAEGAGPEHRHHFVGFTSTELGHNHEFHGWTGPAIHLPDGRHYHVLEGFTEVTGTYPHRHFYRAVTNYMRT